MADRAQTAAQQQETREIAARLEPLPLPERLRAACGLVSGRLVLTTSFGLDDQVVTDAVFRQNLPIDVVTLDTGRLFPETYELWSETEQRYGRRIAGYTPSGVALEALISTDGINGLRLSVDARKRCCGVRKVEPLGRALSGAHGWITGLRRDQSGGRGDTPLAEFEATYGLIKINPIVDWARTDVIRHVKETGIPYNPLHDRGFVSIGCAPCTRAIRPGEPERAGRWWWEDDTKKECGLHNRPIPAATDTRIYEPVGIAHDARA